MVGVVSLATGGLMSASLGRHAGKGQGELSLAPYPEMRFRAKYSKWEPYTVVAWYGSGRGELGNRLSCRDL